jgi:hypothetical protein
MTWWIVTESLFQTILQSFHWYRYLCKRGEVGTYFTNNLWVSFVFSGRVDSSFFMNFDGERLLTCESWYKIISVECSRLRRNPRCSPVSNQKLSNPIVGQRISLIDDINITYSNLVCIFKALCILQDGGLNVLHSGLKWNLIPWSGSRKMFFSLVYVFYQTYANDAAFGTLQLWRCFIVSSYQWR